MSEWLECISDGTKCDRDRGDVFAGVAVGDEDFGHGRIITIEKYGKDGYTHVNGKWIE